MHALKINKRQQSRLWSHLLPENTKKEQAAFLFCNVDDDSNEGLIFHTVALKLLRTTDFTVQHEDYIELTDDTLSNLIKQAHTTGTTLVEIHSHPGLWPAVFSFSDREGLKETVPHMRWRLKQRPYLAIVVAPSGFDALVWLGASKIPEPLGKIDVEGEMFTPTNNSIGRWIDD